MSTVRKSVTKRISAARVRRMSEAVKDRKDVASCVLSGPETGAGRPGPLFLPGWTAGVEGRRCQGGARGPRPRPAER